MGFDIDNFIDNVGEQLQTTAENWVKSEVQSRTNVAQTPQPASTLTVAQTEVKAAWDKNKVLILVAGGALLLGALFLMFGKKGGRK